MNAVARLTELLAAAATLIGQPQVALRVTTGLLEAVYVEQEGPQLVASDHGESHQYLARGSDATYVPWSMERARTACEAAGAVLRERPEEYARVEAFASEDPADSVDAVSRAIDAVFAAHLRPDLRRS